MNSSKGQFFNDHAHHWDATLTEKNIATINIIMDRINWKDVDRVLDVGAGTGVLVPFLLDRGIKNFEAVDPSSEMARHYLEKYPEGNIHVKPFEDLDSGNGPFDKIIIFNAFPHFPHPAKVFSKAFSLLKENGSLVIAHSANRETINQIHRNAGQEVADDILIADDKMIRFYKEAGFSQIICEDSDYFFSSGDKL